MVRLYLYSVFTLGILQQSSSTSSNSEVLLHSVETSQLQSVPDQEMISNWEMVVLQNLLPFTDDIMTHTNIKICMLDQF